MTCPTLPLKPFPEKAARTEFDGEKPPLEWNYIRYPEAASYSLTARNGYLRLTGTELVIGDRNSPTFIGRRIQDLYFTATTQVDYDPGKANEEAGMTLLNNGSHFDLLVKKSKGKRVLVNRLGFGSITHESQEIALKPGPVRLAITCERSVFIFSYAQGNDPFREIERVESKFLSSETAGGFTGVYVGLYATGNGTVSTTGADFDWFEYRKKDSR
jgi:alpha-N-arabinofuranosidase